MNALDLASNVIAFTIQTTVIVGAALVVLALLRVGAPGVRYLFLRLLLGLCLLLPLVQPRVPLLEGGDLSMFWLEAKRAGLSLPWQKASPPASGRRVAGVDSADATGKAAWASWILVVIGAVGCARLAWLAAGLVRLRRLRLVGQEAPSVGSFEDLQARVGARAQIRFVPHLGQPITFGARRAVVLLPDMLKTLPPGIQQAVLAHELWHVRRRDWVWVLLEEMLRGALWFHPAIWVLITRIQAAREETVDELAILATGSRRNYLDALVAFADRPCLFAAAAFARRRHLVHRILVISKETVMSSTRVVACSAALVAVVAGTSWYSVSAFPLTVTAQQAPRDRLPPPPPPPAPSKFSEIEARMLRQVSEQPNAVNYHGLATLYFERAFREPSLTPDQKSQIVAQGIAASDSALSYDADFVEAMIYKNLLLRLQAQLTTDPAERTRVIAEADRLRNRAVELRKQQPQRPAMARPGDIPGPPPPPPPPPPDDARGDSLMVDGEFPLRVGGNIAPPRKLRDVRPAYPPDAMVNRIEGVVIVEATIDREGKVREVRVLRSVPGLDEAAVHAVQQWEFEPVLMNGVPKPAIMTATVNFSLK